MTDFVFTSYAFGALYCYQQERLRQSILKVYPDANIRFWHNDNGSSLDVCNVPGARTFHESMYGFKVHCVRNCIDEGFKRVIFLDAAMILEGDISDILETASRMGVLCTRENTDLHTVISQQCLMYIGKTREELKAQALTLVGGSVYIFDFNSPIAGKVFEYWQELEASSMFGSEEEDVRGLLDGHRKDETCMALALDKYGVKPQGFDVVGYHNLGGTNEHKRFTFYKLHFKGIGAIHGHSMNQAIVPIHGNILDLGCRDFTFTDAMKRLEYNVVSVDIGKFDGDYYRIAISDHNGNIFVQAERDPDATHITTDNTGDRVPMMDIETFSKHVSIDRWDLIKMDIEGAEYNILKNAAHPMASQVSVEFHAHCGQRKEQLDQLLDALAEFYWIHNRMWEDKHSAGFNYWDVLLIAKDEVLGSK